MLEKLSYISRRLGERFDLVQAGGGNTSTKLSNGTMYVKTSGIRLSDVSQEFHFAHINHTKLMEHYHSTDWSSLNKHERETKANEIVALCNLTPERRPSIETLLHAVCPYSVLHTHPLLLLQAFSGGENQEKFTDLFAFVSYNTPGIDLTLALDKSRNQFIKANSYEPKGIILENHGLVVYSKTPESAFIQTEECLEIVAQRLGLDFENPYLFCNEISEQMELLLQEPLVTIYAGKTQLQENLSPFFPDGVVFLSAGPIFLEDNNFSQSIKNYFFKHGIYPKVFVHKGKVYINGKNFSKAREIQEVWDLHLQVIQSKVKINFLSNEEIYYLSHWEAEKYRQKV